MCRNANEPREALPVPGVRQIATCANLCRVWLRNA